MSSKITLTQNIMKDISGHISVPIKSGFPWQYWDYTA